MKTNITKSVGTTKTIDDKTFQRILTKLECDTAYDMDCVGMCADLLIEDAAYILTYRVNFYGCQGSDHILQFDKHDNYRKLIPSFGNPVIEKIEFTPGQRNQLQQILYKEVDRIEKERSDQEHNLIKEAIGFDPYKIFGLKQTQFI